MQNIEKLEGTELQYNENAPPSTDLKQTVDPSFTLHKVVGRKMANEVLSCKFDQQGEMLALGLKNGTRILYSIKEEKFVAKSDDLKENAITSMKWRPSNQGKHKILAAADAGGHLTFLHAPSLKPVFSIHEHENSINTVDFTPNGKIFATGGKDCHIRIYDQQTKSVVHDFEPAGWNNTGHDNRVFALKFIDDHTMISGGWDSVVHIWDVRSKKASQHFYGPHISGQSLDYQNGMVFAGCYAAEKQLQFWDIRALKKVQEIDWTSGNVDDAEYIYAAGINKRYPSMFGAGSTGPNSEIRIFKEVDNNPHKHRQVMSISGLPQGCFSFDFCSKNNRFAFTTPHHGLYLYEYNKAE